ncbi:MAG: GntR family transcriptional regulator [Clostridia bacterium]|nr:GntR family transcriptional regulator [Clostridia bacterium]
MNHKMLSIADQIFNELEHDILTGVYEHDELLTELKLSETLGVSRTPVREALSRLAQEHIVEMTSKGARVMGITEKDIEDIYAIRYRIESLAAKMAAENADEQGLKELKRLLDLQEFYTEKDDHDGTNAADSGFHQALYALTKSPTMIQTLGPLHRRIVKYRRVSYETPDRAITSLGEHRGIYEAIAAGDGEKAEELMRVHIEKARKSILGK